MMNLTQQARYLASNSGGSWFNSAFSYQVSCGPQDVQGRHSRVKPFSAYCAQRADLIWQLIASQTQTKVQQSSPNSVLPGIAARAGM